MEDRGGSVGLGLNGDDTCACEGVMAHLPQVCEAVGLSSPVLPHLPRALPLCTCQQGSCHRCLSADPTLPPPILPKGRAGLRICIPNLSGA